MYEHNGDSRKLLQRFREDNKVKLEAMPDLKVSKDYIWSNR